MLVALGVTGGIAAYKAPEIVRGLTRAGAEVQAIVTANGSRFVAPLTLRTLTRRPVLLHTFEGEGSEQAVRHVELARECAVLAVAPATADALAKFARGIADDLLSTFHLAFSGPLVLAPAMNTRMWEHPAVRENVEILRARGARLVGPARGWLAEGETGWGRMAEPDEIVAAVLAAASATRALAGKTVVVTAGPTREPIDPVRFLSNRSSGKMGYALAEAAARRGARVILVSGPTALPDPPGVEVVRVERAEEMRRAVLEVRGAADALFMAAAVADYAPVAAATKREKTGAALVLELPEGPDILAELGRTRPQGDRCVLVGFAAQTHDLLERAREKLLRKNCDWIVANDVSTPGLGMDADRNAVTLIDRAGNRVDLAPDLKSRIAEGILDRVLGAP